MPRLAVSVEQLHTRIMDEYAAGLGGGSKAYLILLAVALVVAVVARVLWQTLYNIFLHPLSAMPGPVLAKVSDNYLTPATAALHRAQTLRKLHVQYGSVVRVAPNEVSISDWKAYREIYSQKGSSKTDSFYRATSLVGHENIFTFRNKNAHAGRRKLQNPSYSQQAVLANEALIADKAEILVRRLAKTGEDVAVTGRKVDAFRLAGLFSLEVILACAFNRRHGDTPSRDALTLLESMDSSAVAIRTMASIPILNRKIGVALPGPIGRSFQKWDLWQAVTENLLREFQEQEVALDKEAQKFMVTPLIVNEDTYLGRKLTQSELVEELMGLTFAGSGTTSTTLTYLLYALSKDTERQERLRRELQSVGESVNEIKNLAYLNAVIKETLRLYPTIMSTLPRILDRPLNIGNHILPKGTFVGMQNYVHHRDPEVFPHPDEYLPERWLSDTAASGDMEAAITPFSVGPRNCIGQNLARAELYLAVSHIFRKLRLQLHPEMNDGDMEMEDRFNIAPRGRKLLLEVWKL